MLFLAFVVVVYCGDDDRFRVVDVAVLGVIVLLVLFLFCSCCCCCYKALYPFISSLASSTPLFVFFFFFFFLDNSPSVTLHFISFHFTFLLFIQPQESGIDGSLCGSQAK